MNIFNLPRTEEEAVKFLQEEGVLQAKRFCRNGHEMKLSFGSQIRWRSNKSTCRSEVKIRNGTWFKDTRLPFLTAVRFSYCWSEELTSIKWCKKQLEMSDETTVDWNILN